MATLAGQIQAAAASTGATLTGGATPTLAGMQAITNGTLSLMIGGVPITARGLNFAGAATLAACAAIIASAISQHATCTYASTHFVITANRVGLESTISFATGTAAAPALLRSTDGGTLAQGTSPVGPQWLPCRGQHIYPQRWVGVTPTFPLPHTGLSFGDGRDYIRNVGRWSGASRVFNRLGGLMRLPYDPSNTYYVSIADNSSEAPVSGGYTVQKPPPGVK
jgi:Protein of unknown function (DUF3383)